uniref:Neurotoxin LmNaTx17 n=1 Tax=Lychas mucronatus TaxID=172552 RepID=SNA17_LYCMC|nr:RecName: Full=Neurotoxin LmNaTx17; Flags: Precursor [Lychas mucronatus]ABX76765.1 neurotoxin LmNaTx17 precursor [Lychas mucronatus]
MKILFVIVLAAFFIGVHCKHGYPVQYSGREKGCKIACVINNASCDGECKRRGGRAGYCYFWKLACFCEYLPNNSPTWDYKTGKCRV